MLGYHQSTTSRVYDIEQLREAVSALNHGLSFKYAENAELLFYNTEKGIFVGTFLKTRIAKRFFEHLWLLVTKRKPHCFDLRMFVKKPGDLQHLFDARVASARQSNPNERLIAEKSMMVFDKKHGKSETVILMFEHKAADHELSARHLAGYDPKAA